MGNMKIRFGSNYGILLKDINLKKNIVNYLFSNIDLSKYRYNMLKNDMNLSFLKNNKHYVSPNFRGINYLILFMLVDSKKYCVLIDKKNLSYHKKNINYYKLNIIKIKMLTNNNLFNGTILDGKLISMSEKKIDYFLIKDCYMMMNTSCENMEMSQKMEYLNSILKNNFNGKNYCSNFVFKLNKLYDYEDIEDIKKRAENKDSNDIPIMGLEFFPKFSGISVVWLNRRKNTKITINDKISNNNYEKNIENFSYDLIHNLPKVLMQRIYSYENGTERKKLYLKKTDITDVYNVYNIEDKERIGIAHIPNFKISRTCQDNVTNNYTMCECVYYNKFKKWIPLSIC